MRILMIADFYWPYLGGVEQHVRSLSAALVERGHSVAVATLWQAGLAHEEEDGGVRVYRMRGSMQRASMLFSHPERTWAPPFPDPEITLALRGVLAREQPEIVHGHDWLARSFLPLQPFTKAKFVASLHYYTLSCAKKNLMYKGALCAGPALAKCVSCASEHYGSLKGTTIALANMAFASSERGAADLLIAVSHATAQGNGVAEDRQRCRVIPNFVPDVFTGQNVDTAPYIAQLPSDEYLLFVGDLRRDKGLNVLLEAYAGLSNPPPLVLIGKVWSETPTQFPSGVHIFQKWPNSAVMEAWRRSMLALVPSIWSEPFGIVVIEAMVCGRPVIGSRIGGIPDMVIDGENGLLVTPGDATALRSAIARLVADPELRQRMGQAAQRKAAEFYSSAVVPQIEQVYLDVLHSTESSTKPGAYYREDGSA